MIKLTFLGDIMCDYTMSNNLNRYLDLKTNKYDFSCIFTHIKRMLQQSDYVFANLETPISENNNDLTKAQWSFNSPYEFAQAIANCGIRFTSTANNHCLDRGLLGLESTIRSLDSIGLKHCGTQIKKGNEYCIVSVEGLQIGVLAYTYGTNAFSNYCYLPHNRYWAVNLLQEQEERIHNKWRSFFHNRANRIYNYLDKRLYPDNLKRQIYEKETFHLFRKALILRDIKRVKKKKVDLIVAYLHVGGQYNILPSSYTIRVTDWFINNGCVFVIDNHEHVVHGSKINDSSVATYALGNLVSSAGVENEPYDRRADFSIAFHAYFDKESKQIKRVTFSVLKTIKNEKGCYEVWPVFDLLKISQGNTSKLLKDALKVAEDFSGIAFNSVEEEYILKEWL